LKFIKIMFEKPSEWKDVSIMDKRRYFFMINRYMSINYPLQASVLQTRKINGEQVVDFWQTFISKQYKRTPSWIYTKGTKKNKEKKDKAQIIPDKLIKEYAFDIQVDVKSVYDAMLFFPNEMAAELKKYEKSLKI
ncbi:MAG: hypothetical protein RSE41_07320, partial [Clostridia bacterium]